MSRNNKRVNSVKYGICTNMEPKPDGAMCSLCQKKEKQAIRTTKDFVCAECGAPLKETMPPPPPPPIIITILSIVLLAAAVVIGIINHKNHKGNVSVPDPDTTGNDSSKINLSPTDTVWDTVYITDTTFVVRYDTITETMAPSQKKVAKNAGGNATKGAIQFSIGKYVGDLKNGIPEGEGKMNYSCRVQIAKHDTDNPPHFAEAGDWFDGTWGNGDIISGVLYNKDGKIKEKIFAPKRFNPYDLSKERCQ